MSHNSFGHLFRITTFGESHGPALGCVVDGCPPRLPLVEADIQAALDRRKPGQSRFTTQRREPDLVKILSGVFIDDSGQQVTTGTPIALMIENTDQRSKDYGDIKDAFRPGHADYTYEAKYGIRDYRGGGRSSARETAARVAGGAVAAKVIQGVRVRGALVQIGPHKIARENFDWAEVGNNPFFCPDAAAAKRVGRSTSTVFARRAPRSARSSRSSPRGFRRDGARPSTASSIPISPRPSCRSTR